MKSIIEKERFGLEYIRYKRFVVEIKDENSGHIHYSKRFCQRYTAATIKNDYNKLKGLLARLFDTKTGEIC
jgi:hypothetical protein